MSDPKQLQQMLKIASIEEHAALEILRNIAAVCETREIRVKELVTANADYETELAKLIREGKSQVFLSGSSQAIKKWRHECRRLEHEILRLNASIEEAQAELEMAQRALERHRATVYNLQQKRSKLREVGDQRDKFKSNLVSAQEEDALNDGATTRSRK